MEVEKNEIKEEDKSKQNPNPPTNIITLYNTMNYGYLTQDDYAFDDAEFFTNILNYKLFKIKVWFGKIDKEDCVKGIQFFYKNRANGEIISPGEHKSEAFDGSEEYQLKENEIFVDFQISFNTKITSIEFITNKDHKFKVGGVGDSITPNLRENKNIIIGSLGNFNNSFLCTFGVYYVSAKTLYIALMEDYFKLRHYLKDTKKKEAIMKDYSKLSTENKAIVSICLLPDIAFLCVMKFAVN